MLQLGCVFLFNCLDFRLLCLLVVVEWHVVYLHRLAAKKQIVSAWKGRREGAQSRCNHCRCPFSSLLLHLLLSSYSPHNLPSLVTRCNHSHCNFSSLITSSLIISSLLLYTRQDKLKHDAAEKEARIAGEAEEKKRFVLYAINQ